MSRCDKCPRKAIIYQRYSGMHLCREHFEEDVHRKIREALRRTGLFGHGARIAMGLDGGRRSATLAFVLKNIFIRRKDIDIFAIIIDEGREGQSTNRARQVADLLDIPYAVRSLPLLPLRSLRPALHGPSLPGEGWEGGAGIADQKREMLFCAAREKGAGVLATGEDLDDEALQIFINYLRGDVDAVMSETSGAGAEGRDPIAWIKPLRRIPEKEVRLYAIGHGLGYDDGGGDPSAGEMKWEAKRLLCGFDCRHPGTNYSLLRSVEKGPGGKTAAFARAKPLSEDAK
jgi:tRNA(Ile)-lysidine synthase TilS/MesJ